jgi:hypothetical protein
MTAFIITAWITILASTVASLRSWKMIKSPYFIRFALGAEDLLGPLCDLQAITGAAIIIAGFSQWQTITYYHRELVGSYWYLTSNSFWSARRAYMYVSTETPVSVPSIRMTPTSGTSTGMTPTGAAQTGATTIKRAEANKDWTVWRVYTRRVFIVISVALGIAWSASSAILEIHGWDERDPNKCYDYNDATYNNQGIYYNGVMLVGLFLYFASLLLSFVDRDGKVATKYNELFESFLEIPEGKLCDYVEALKEQRGGFNLSHSQLWLALIWGLVYWAARILRGIIAVWSYGDSHSPEFFLFYYLFVSWNTWDIIMLKVLNEHLVSDETKMGFGQVLPLVLLAQIGLNIVDIWKGKLHSVHQVFHLPSLDPSKATERKTECQDLIKKKSHVVQCVRRYPHYADAIT